MWCYDCGCYYTVKCHFDVHRVGERGYASWEEYRAEWINLGIGDPDVAIATRRYRRFAERQLTMRLSS